MPSVLEKKSFKYVKETCPALDEIMDDLLYKIIWLTDSIDRDDLIPLFAAASEKIKDKCTKPLREALVDVIYERDDLEEELRERDEMEAAYI